MLRTRRPAGTLVASRRGARAFRFRRSRRFGVRGLVRPDQGTISVWGRAEQAPPAHYAGATPLDLLNKEQNRISGGLDTMRGVRSCGSEDRESSWSNAVA